MSMLSAWHISKLVLKLKMRTPTALYVFALQLMLDNELKSDYTNNIHDLLMRSVLFFDSWTGLLRVIVVGVLAYASLVLLLRFTGKRTLTKMNAFDFVVTIAIGSTLSSVIITESVALMEGVLALTLLCALQYIVTWSSVRSKSIRNIIKSEPRLLFHNSEFLYSIMQKERIMEEEILQAVRNDGLSSMSSVNSVVLETDGSLSIIKKSSVDSNDTLRNVEKKES